MSLERFFSDNGQEMLTNSVVIMSQTCKQYEGHGSDLFPIAKFNILLPPGHPRYFLTMKGHHFLVEFLVDYAYFIENKN